MFLSLDVLTSQQCYLASELARIPCSKLEPLVKGSRECWLHSTGTLLRPAVVRQAVPCGIHGAPSTQFGLVRKCQPFHWTRSRYAMSQRASRRAHTKGTGCTSRKRRSSTFLLGSRGPLSWTWFRVKPLGQYCGARNCPSVTSVRRWQSVGRVGPA